jgi:hypothetical protein
MLQWPLSGDPNRAAKQAAESNRGKQSQSIEPLRPTRAAVALFPTIASSSISRVMDNLSLLRVLDLGFLYLSHSTGGHGRISPWVNRCKFFVPFGKLCIDHLQVVIQSRFCGLRSSKRGGRNHDASSDSGENENLRKKAYNSGVFHCAEPAYTRPQLADSWQWLNLQRPSCLSNKLTSASPILSRTTRIRHGNMP